MRALAAIGFCLLTAGCGKAPVAELAGQLTDSRAAVRRTAARALDQRGTDARSAVPALTTAIGDQDRDVRRLACHALGRIGLDARPAIPQLTAALRDEDLSVRLVAAFALQKIDPAGRAYVSVLTQAMQMGEGGVIVAVGDMGSEAGWAVPSLVQLLLRDRRPGTRRLAAEALGKMGPAARDAEPSLRQALHDRDDRVREAATKALQAVQSSVLP